MSLGIGHGIFYLHNCKFIGFLRLPEATSSPVGVTTIRTLCGYGRADGGCFIL